MKASKILENSTTLNAEDFIKWITESAKNEIVSSELKKSSGKNIIPAMKRYIKSCDDAKPVFKGYWIYEKHQFLCNGYSEVRLLISVKSGELLIVSDEMLKANDYNKRVSEILIKASENSGKVFRIKFSDLKVLKAQHKPTKQNKIYVRIDNSAYDLTLLYNILDIIGDAYITMSTAEQNPIYINGVLGDAILLPIRVDDIENVKILVGKEV